jgi:hypothetical protein
MWVQTEGRGSYMGELGWEKTRLNDSKSDTQKNGMLHYPLVN